MSKHRTSWWRRIFATRHPNRGWRGHMRTVRMLSVALVVGGVALVGTSGTASANPVPVTGTFTATRPLCPNGNTDITGMAAFAGLVPSHPYGIMLHSNDLTGADPTAGVGNAATSSPAGTLVTTLRFTGDARTRIPPTAVSGTWTLYYVHANGMADEVLNGTFSVPACPSPAKPTVTLSSDKSTLVVGQSATLSWGSTLATSLTASGAWSGSKSIPSGSEKVTPAASGTYTYTLTAAGPGGTAMASVTLTVTKPTPPPVSKPSASIGDAKCNSAHPGQGGIAFTLVNGKDATADAVFHVTVDGDKGNDYTVQAGHSYQGVAGPLSNGSHTVRITSSGMEPVSKTVKVECGSSPSPSPSPSEHPSPSPSPSHTTSPSPSVSPSESHTTTPQPSETSHAATPAAAASSGGGSSGTAASGGQLGPVPYMGFTGTAADLAQPSPGNTTRTIGLWLVALGLALGGTTLLRREAS